MAKLAIGTVQFGLDYGIANTVGMTSEDEVHKILALAKDKNIKLLDTAQKYGISEEVLGRVGVAGYNIVTKLVPPLNLENSLKRLNVESVYGLLFHSAQHLLREPELWSYFEKYRDMGKTKKIGVSVYTEEEIISVIKSFAIDIIQLPFSIFDQRLQRTGLLNRLKDMGVEVHVRSVFLQGLLLMNGNAMPEYFASYSKVFNEFEMLSIRHSMPRLEVALGFVLQVQEIDTVVCGIDNSSQLVEIIEIYEKIAKNKSAYSFDEFHGVNDPDLLDPSRWRVNDKNRSNWSK